jgi:hypothetical protein
MGKYRRRWVEMRKEKEGWVRERGQEKRTRE